MQTIITRSFFLLLIIFSISVAIKQFVLAEDIPSDCLSEYFDKIKVTDNEITIVDIQRSGYVNKFVITPSREIELYAFDNKGNQRFSAKKKDICAYIGEEMGECLELSEWNGNEASFKLSWHCLEPACNPGESKKCMLEVKDNWEKKE